MLVAGACLGWSEAEFWAASLQYFRAGWDGFLERHGIGAKSEDELSDALADFEHEHAAALSRTDDELAQLRAGRGR